MLYTYGNVYGVPVRMYTYYNIIRCNVMYDISAVFIVHLLCTLPIDDCIFYRTKAGSFLFFTQRTNVHSMYKLTDHLN